MSRGSAKKIKRDDLMAKAKKALEEAVERVKEEHRRSGEPMAIWRDGRVVFVHPGENTVPQPEIRETQAKYKSTRHKRISK